VTAVVAVPSRHQSRIDDGSSSSGDATVFTDAESAATGEVNNGGEVMSKEKAQELQVITYSSVVPRTTAVVAIAVAVAVVFAIVRFSKKHQRVQSQHAVFPIDSFNFFFFFLHSNLIYLKTGGRESSRSKRSGGHGQIAGRFQKDRGSQQSGWRLAREIHRQSESSVVRGRDILRPVVPPVVSI